MSTLQNKIDFAVVFSVNKANPNERPARRGTTESRE